MSIKAVAWALEQKLGGDGIAKLVLIGMADRYNDEYGYAWPSIEWLAIAADCSQRTVMRKVQKLEEIGFVSVERRANKGNRYTLNMTIGDNLSRDTAVSPIGDSHMSPEQYRTIHNKNSAKQKLVDWSPTDKDRIYAKERGLDPDAVFESIRLWNKQNGDKAAYSDCGAFWMNWCRREAERKPKAVSGHSRPFNGQSSEWTPPQRKMVTLDQWKKLSDNMRTYYKQNRPDVIAELKGLGADV
jgi:biotin operon repressor